MKTPQQRLKELFLKQGDERESQSHYIVLWSDEKKVSSCTAGYLESATDVKAAVAAYAVSKSVNQVHVSFSRNIMADSHDVITFDVNVSIDAVETPKKGK